MTPDPAQPPFIFVVDDLASERELIKRAQMQYCPDCRLLLAGTTDEADKYLAQVAVTAMINLIIVDLRCPGMLDGLELVRRIKASDCCDVPLVVFTTSDSEMDRRKVLEAGASAFVNKPVDYDEYQAALSEIFRTWIPDHFKSHAA
jgi:CheY-like chemotaxis protein